uniref:DUF659 domain-containing protein n=1 Tax=Latimeria chalumnae TaxID=7897 RepID=H3AMW5_LATCH
NLAVMFDKMPDAEGRCILNILAAPLVPDTEGKVKSYMLDLVFPDKCNKSTVSIAVTNTLQEFNIQNENVVIFNTDNATYMVAAYNTALKVLFPNALHITCMAHIMNLVGESFQKSFKQLSDFILYFSHMFYMAGSRKRCYLSFMHSKLQGTAHADFFQGAKDMNMTTKLDIMKTCSIAYEDAGGKLEKYLSGAQPGITFLKEVRIFNPARISLLPSEKSAYSNIPNFNTVPDSEFMSYVTIYGPDAVKNSARGVVDVDLFWSSMVAKMPKFSRIAKSLMYTLSNSANVERLNSMYKMI